MTATPQIQEVIQEAIDSTLLDVRVALPCKVESYTPSRQTVDVIPQLKEPAFTEAGNRRLQDLPILRNVPVQFMRAGGFVLTMPINPGDFMLVIVCDAISDSGERRERLATLAICARTRSVAQ